MASLIAAVRLPLLSCAALLCAVALQGCNVSVPRHGLGNWEVKSNYLTDFQYVLPGTPKTAILNSCNNPALTSGLQCNGHGKCAAWNDLPLGADNQAPRLHFCECDRDWADPECRTPRKSQVTAFTLALFLGMFGVDQLYLGFVLWAIVKFLLVSVAGFWCASRILSSKDGDSALHLKLFLILAIYIYLYDICRIGSSPALTAHNFRVAADLSHFTFVLTSITLMLFFGFATAIKSIHDDRKGKAHKLLLHRLDAREEAEDPNYGQGASWGPPGPLPNPQRAMTNPNLSATPQQFTGYGATVPGNLLLPGSQHSMNPLVINRPQGEPMTAAPGTFAGPTPTSSNLLQQRQPSPGSPGVVRPPSYTAAQSQSPMLLPQVQQLSRGNLSPPPTGAVTMMQQTYQLPSAVPGVPIPQTLPQRA